MIHRNDLIKKVESNIGLDSFINENFRNIAKKISEIYSQKGLVEFSDIIPMLNTTEISGDIIDIISNQDSSEKSVMTDQNQNAEKMLIECSRFIKKRKIKEGLKQAKKEMFALNKSKDSVQEVDNLLTKFHRKNIDFHSTRNSG
jgi:hypothetical protein